jgi:hypothetical protein
MPAGEQTNVKQPNLQPKAAATAPRSAEYFSGTVSPTFLFKPAKTDSNRCVQVAFKKLRSGLGQVASEDCILVPFWSSFFCGLVYRISLHTTAANASIENLEDD